jgi:hypothetical protein
LYCSTNIRVTKLRSIRWGRGAYGKYGEEKCMQVFGGGTQRERDHWEHPGVDGRIILTGILRQQAPRIGNAFIWLRREN